MKPLNAKKTIKILLENGFILVRQKGSHQIFKHSINGNMVIVASHNKNKPIKIGTFLTIIKQSKLPPEKFE